MIDKLADRLRTALDAGSNGGTAWTRPSSVPASSATLLVTNYVYNAAGWLQDVTDPMGLDTRTLYDNLGRTTKTIQDYTNGTETAESNITTEYGYDGNGNVTYVQADQPGSSYQKTAYVYGVTTAAGDGINSNDILSAVQHPDKSSGNPSSSQQDRKKKGSGLASGAFQCRGGGRWNSPAAAFAIIRIPCPSSSF